MLDSTIESRRRARNIIGKEEKSGRVNRNVDPVRHVLASKLASNFHDSHVASMNLSALSTDSVHPDDLISH